MGQLLTHIVCKSFGDDTINADDLQRRLAGEVVNGLFWPNIEGLEKNRHVVAMPDGLEPVADSFGRFWIDVDALNRAEREPMQAEVEVAPEVATVTQPDANLEMHTVLDPSGVTTVDVTPNAPWFMDVDLDANPTEFVKHGFDMPKKVSERRWQLWDGTVVAGKTKANKAHSAGLRARIRELRTEHAASAAGSVTNT